MLLTRLPFLSNRKSPALVAYEMPPGAPLSVASGCAIPWGPKPPPSSAPLPVPIDSDPYFLTIKYPSPARARSVIFPVWLMAPCPKRVVTELVATPLDTATLEVPLELPSSGVDGRMVCVRASAKSTLPPLNPTVFKLARLFAMTSKLVWKLRIPPTPVFSDRIILFLSA